jgi:hypothetical protein
MRANKINGRFILFICPKFHEYPDKIKRTIESLGGNVDLYYIEKKSLLSTIFLNLSKKVYKKYRCYQHYKILDSIKNRQYDYVFIQSPYYLSHKFMKRLKRENKNAFFINYNWDSIKDLNYLDYMKYFSKVFSFDRTDCDRNKEIDYLPLFYSSDFNFKNRKKPIYDLAFIGGIGDSVGRYNFLQEIKENCNALNINYYFHLYISPNYFIKSLIFGRLYKGISFKKLKLRNIADIYSKSNCVLDYHNPKQSGFTMRTFEVLGNGNKLLTTNANIVDAPFFNDNIINTIKLNGIILRPKFIKKELLIYNNILDYSLINWIKTIFCV